MKGIHSPEHELQETSRTVFFLTLDVTAEAGMGRCSEVLLKVHLKVTGPGLASTSHVTLAGSCSAVP